MLEITKGIFATISVALLLLGRVTTLEITLGDVSVSLSPSDNGIQLQATANNEDKIVGILGFGKNLSTVQCLGEANCEIEESTLNIEKITDGIKITWETNEVESEFRDCFDLQNGVNWYGGPERRVQKWPIEKMSIDGSEPYVSKKTDNFGVAERYWLNSKGAYIYLDERVPLFVDQNVAENGKVCFIAKLDEPFVNRKKNILTYHIIFKDNPKVAHLHAVNNFLGKPTGHPDSRMISEPIWTTWAKYKRDINDSVVVNFAQDIRNQGYTKGQIEIDDNWEICYGAQEFSPDTFSAISNTVNKLKELNFRVTLWVHPFVNSDCQNIANEGLAKGYFVKNDKGSTEASWWDGTDAHQIDFTKPEAVEWWSARLRKLQNDQNIDSFKFDAGETNYGPQPSVYENVDQEKVPNILTESYVRTSAKFGSLIEVRSAWRTQDLPVFLRMIDKDSNWSEDNGLPTLITTLLQMNLNGYTMILPDMIGGNGYNMETPSAELMVRWTQANTFMPAMQFSYLPWEITSDQFDAPAIIFDFVSLHGIYSNIIMAAMEENVRSGAPVNPPIWWIDPTDPVALACDDEYLVGEKMLIAPVLKEGARSRTIYLPKGTWQDGNDNSLYHGPTSIEYEADIDILPYFLYIG